MVRKEGRFVEALGRYRLLIAGAILVALVSLFGLVGQLFVPVEMSEVGAGLPAKPPSAEHLLGTDQQGRDVLADLIYGTPTSLEIGVIAGVLGVTLGALMGLIAGYAGGIVDEVIRIIVDVLLTIPSLMILIIVASMLGVGHGRGDGADHCGAGLDVASARSARTGAHHSRAHVCPGSQVQRCQQHEDHHRGTAAESGALSGGQPGRRDFWRDPRLGGTLDTWARASDQAVAGSDLLLGHHLWRPDPPDVVVVYAAHRYHRHPLPGALPDEPGSGPNRQPQAPEQSVIPANHRWLALAQGHLAILITEVRFEFESFFRCATFVCTTTPARARCGRSTVYPLTCTSESASAWSASPVPASRPRHTR